jgi:putative ABC transport system permease protein
MSGTIVDTLITGLPLVPLVLGIYLVLRIREDFDLTVEGSFTIGGAVAAALLVNGQPVAVALALAILAGAGAGLITTAVHVGLGVPIILAGLVTTIGLYSIDLRVMETPSIALTSATTLFSGFDGLSPAERDWAIIGVLALIGVIVLAGVGLFLRTEIGLALRVSGANTRLVRSQGVNERFLIALNLLLANALCGLSGALLVQGQGFADVNMGAGVLVAGLGALLLGELVTRPSGSRILRGLAAVLVGAVLYRLVLTIAINAGLPPTDLKLATALTLIAAFALHRAMSWAGRARPRRRRTAALVEGHVYEEGRAGA